MKSTPSISHEEISKRAHDIWEQCGRLEGQDTEHWLRAEGELRQEREQASHLSATDRVSVLAETKNQGRAKPSRAGSSR